MSQEVQGAVRHLLTAVGGVLISLGYTSSSVVEPLVGVAMTVIGFGWSFMSKKSA